MNCRLENREPKPETVRVRPQTGVTMTSGRPVSEKIRKVLAATLARAVSQHRK